MDVTAELEAARRKYRSIEVEREVAPKSDLGRLALFDESSFRLNGSVNLEEQLMAVCRDNAQLLVNGVFSLPTRREGTTVVAELPPPTTPLPREKPLPKAKPLTRWEQFAKSKGIQKKKRSRMVWDEAKQAWLPRWGYNRANDDQNDWVIEVPRNSDPFEDQYEKRATDKTARIAKNRASQQRNQETADRLARKTLRQKTAALGALPSAAARLGATGRSQLTETVKDSAMVNVIADARSQRAATRKELETKLAVTRRSTASMGKFDKALKTDKPLKERQVRMPVAGDRAAERKRALELIDKVRPSGGEFSERKAVNFIQQEDERARKRQRR